MTLFDLSGKVALVTGGGRGMGRGMALALARQGAAVAVASRSPTEVEEAAAAIREAGAEALAISVDLAHPQQVAAAVEQTVAAFGQLDVLVTAAGFIIRKAAEDYTEDDWDSLHAVNLRARFFSCVYAGRHMLARGHGSIITVASVTAALGIPNQAIYAAANGAVPAMTRALAAEWTPRGVRINCIAPGTFATDQTAAVLNDPGLAAARMGRIPARRFGDPEHDLDGAIVFLASEASSYVSGQTLFVDGGTTATY